jgi:hypothetical protein
LISIKINQCTDDIELMKKQIKNLKEDIKILGDGFGEYKTVSKSEIDEYLKTGSGGIIILIFKSDLIIYLVYCLK